MSKTYKQITPVEALKRLTESGKPIDGLFFRDFDGEEWRSSLDFERSLTGVTFEEVGAVFLTRRKDNKVVAAWRQCAELIEEAPKPWTFETCPRERCWLRRSTTGIPALYLLSTVRKTSAAASGYGEIEWHILASEWQHSLDNGKTWLPCTQ